MKKMLIAVAALSLLTSAGLFSEEYALKIPDGWTKKEAAALAQYQKGTGTFILTLDTMPAEANTPDKYVEFVKGKLKGSFKDIAFETTLKGKKGKYETRELFYKVKTYGMVLKYDVLYVFTKTQAYTLTTANTEAASNAAFKKEIQDIFSGFSLK